MELTGNSTLDMFSPALREEICAAARPCTLALGTILVHRGRIPANLVFLTSGMASLVVTMKDGSPSEVGMLGSESLTGIATMLGPEASHPDCVVQIAGDGLQVPRQTLLRLFQVSSEFRNTILRAIQSQMNIAAQISACNLRHQAPNRFSRWLLTACDRVESDTLHMTQEYLAEMIGTRRTTVSAIVGPLASRGFLRQSRGTIQILDRPAILNVACECYEICRKWTYSDHDHPSQAPISAPPGETPGVPRQTLI